MDFEHLLYADNIKFLNKEIAYPANQIEAWENIHLQAKRTSNRLNIANVLQTTFLCGLSFLIALAGLNGVMHVINHLLEQSGFNLIAWIRSIGIGLVAVICFLVAYVLFRAAITMMTSVTSGQANTLTEDLVKNHLIATGKVNSVQSKNEKTIYYTYIDADGNEINSRYISSTTTDIQTNDHVIAIYNSRFDILL